MTARVSAWSDAAQFESRLHRWASEKVQAGRLGDSDVKEIFPESDSLRLGGEDPSKNFREMVSDIAVLSAPPVYPGIVSLLVGLGGLLSSLCCMPKNSAKQAAT